MKAKPLLFGLGAATLAVLAYRDYRSSQSIAANAQKLAKAPETKEFAEHFTLDAVVDQKHAIVLGTSALALAFAAYSLK